MKLLVDVDLAKAFYYYTNREGKFQKMRRYVTNKQNPEKTKLTLTFCTSTPVHPTRSKQRYQVPRADRETLNAVYWIVTFAPF